MRPKRAIPFRKYRRGQRRPTDKARGFIEWAGERHYFPGEYGSDESMEAYRRFLAAIIKPAAPPEIATGKIGPNPTIVEIVELYLNWARTSMVDPSGALKPELGHVRRAMGVLIQVCPTIPIAEFGPRRLKEVRDAMLTVTKTIGKGDRARVVPANWKRSYINAQVARIRRFFKWAVSEEYVPNGVLLALQTVGGLRQGGTPAEEGREVVSVSEDAIEAAKQFLTPTLKAMVDVQLHTGMRSGEMVIMRPCDIRTDIQPWEYRPQQFKSKKRAKAKKIDYVVFLGPKAQAALAPLMKRAPESFVFSPAESTAWRYEQRWKNAKTARKKPPKTPRKIGDCYTSRTYRRAIWYAIQRAEGQHWHPHQIRHTAGNAVSQRFQFAGMKAAMRHAHLSATQVYSERDLDLARKIALEMG